jgi:hypothetical protein
LGLPVAHDFSLTKSRFADYLTCPGYAWLKRHDPAALPEIHDPATERARFHGIEVDGLARERFPGGVLVETLDVELALIETAGLLADPVVTVIFQAAVRAAEGYLVRADVMVRDGAGWRLIEVKSVCSIGSEHLDDATFQVATLEMAGTHVSQVSILHLDRTYHRSGPCNPALLFVETDCTTEVRSRQEDTAAQMTVARAVLAQSDTPAQCECHRKTRSSQCPAFAIFHSEVPETGSIYELANLRAGKLSEVIDRGIIALRDWPDDVALSESQQRQLDVHRSGRAVVDEPALRDLLAELAYPLYFLDYETVSVPVPMYDGCRPYQQVPFQYSLHVVTADGSCQHHEYLATETGINPMHALAVHMAERIGPSGSVVAWHAPFERGRNTELAASLPEAAAFFEDLNGRMVDLEEAVRKGFYAHPGFKGRSSIKAVLPVAAPELSYDTLEIGGGLLASERWLACALGEVTGLEREHTFAALRAYCCQDTWGMVRIWQHLSELCGLRAPAQDGRFATDRPYQGDWSLTYPDHSTPLVRGNAFHAADGRYST